MVTHDTNGFILSNIGGMRKFPVFYKRLHHLSFYLNFLLHSQNKTDFSNMKAKLGENSLWNLQTIAKNENCSFLGVKIFNRIFLKCYRNSNEMIFPPLNISMYGHQSFESIVFPPNKISEFLIISPSEKKLEKLQHIAVVNPILVPVLVEF